MLSVCVFCCFVWFLRFSFCSIDVPLFCCFPFGLRSVNNIPNRSQYVMLHSKTKTADHTGKVDGFQILHSHCLELVSTVSPSAEVALALFVAMAAPKPQVMDEKLGEKLRFASSDVLFGAFLEGLIFLGIILCSGFSRGLMQI